MVVQSIYRVSRGGQIKFKLYWQFASIMVHEVNEKMGENIKFTGKKKKKKNPQK
jgi:hypothetical protein